MDIVTVIQKFDDFLYTNGHQEFQATIVGGAALNLLKVISRVTNDVDILQPDFLPPFVEQLAESFAKENSLPLGWLNCGPADLVSHLPTGWEKRVINVFHGKYLRLVTLGRKELLMTKCWAYCDRERDLNDILAMKPTILELDEVEKWLIPLDANPQWPEYVKKIMLALRKRGAL